MLLLLLLLLILLLLFIKSFIILGLCIFHRVTGELDPLERVNLNSANSYSLDIHNAFTWERDQLFPRCSHEWNHPLLSPDDTNTHSLETLCLKTQEGR